MLKNDEVISPSSDVTFCRSIHCTGRSILTTLYFHISGQFKDLRVRVQENAARGNHGNKIKKTGTMTFPQFINRKSVRVFEGQRLNMASKQHTKCWFVRNNGRGLLEGKIQNYRVPNLLHDRLASGLARRFTI